MIQRRVVPVVVACLFLLLLAPASVLGASSHRTVVMRDACDGPSFNAPPPAGIGPGTCARNGGVTLGKFVDQLHAMHRAPAWRFAPSQMKLASGGTVTATNRGGEFHTFTEVANFGPGCVDFLNVAIGLPAGQLAPECAIPGIFGATGAGPGGTVTTDALGTATHKFQCLIHPWMRTTVNVG
ncbi:MAG: hypothetical protein ACJ77N_11195 [Chloroflexota bacterium]